LSQQRLASVAVGVAAFAGYARACAPSAYLLDSAELAQAAFGLGVAHPSGEPLAALWGRLFCFLPIGSVALRVGIGQAVAGALAAVVLFFIALRLLALLDGARTLGEPTHLLLGAAAALGFAYAPGAVNVSDRPEVYALQTALSLGALLCALRALHDDDRRQLLLAALLLGLGLANHPLVAGLTGLGAALAALPSLRRERARLIALSVLALFAGAAAIAYLPARAGALFAQAAARGADTIAWGDARTLGGLGWVLSARTFATKASIVHTAAAPLDFPFVLMEEVEVAFALLAPLGMAFILRLRPARLPALVVLLSWAGSLGAALYAGFDPANPDVRGYLGPAIALTALFAVGAFAVFATWLRRWRAWIPPVVAAALVLATASRFPAADRYPGLRHAAAADRMTGQLLAELPPRAALLTAHFESAFLVGYQRLVEGRRPDVAWAHLGFIAHPGAALRLGAAEPDLRAVLAARSTANLAALDGRRPVRLEPDDHLPQDLRAKLVPAGSTWKLPDVRPSALTAPPAIAFAEAATDRQVRGFVAWRAYTDARLACANRLPNVARLRLAELDRLLPHDRRALALATECAALSNIPGFLRGAP